MTTAVGRVPAQLRGPRSYPKHFINHACCPRSVIPSTQEVETGESLATYLISMQLITQDSVFKNKMGVRVVRLYVSFLAWLKLSQAGTLLSSELGGSCLAERGRGSALTHTGQARHVAHDCRTHQRLSKEEKGLRVPMNWSWPMSSTSQSSQSSVTRLVPGQGTEDFKACPHSWRVERDSMWSHSCSLFTELLLLNTYCLPSCREMALVLATLLIGIGRLQKTPIMKP